MLICINQKIIVYFVEFIDNVLEWALKNDDQLELFEEEYLSGCLTWGLCDSGLSKKVINELDYEKLSEEDK